MKQYIDTYRVLTVELLMGLLDMPHTASSRRIVEARLQRLVKLKFVRQIRDGYITYYVTPSVIRKGTPQFDHKLMESHVWIALERTLPGISEKQTSDELRKEGGTLIPDGFFRLTDGTEEDGFALEIDTGLDDLGALASKAKRYHRDSFRFNVRTLRVLIVTKRQRRVGHIVHKLMGFGDGTMFQMAALEDINPFDQSILQPIWVSPASADRHSLFGAYHAANPAEST